MRVSLAVSSGHHGAAEAAGLHPPRGCDRTSSAEAGGKLIPGSGFGAETLASPCVFPASLCACLCSASPFHKDTVGRTETHPNDLALASSAKTVFPNKVPSAGAGARASTSFRGT